MYVYLTKLANKFVKEEKTCQLLFNVTENGQSYSILYFSNKEVARYWAITLNAIHIQLFSKTGMQHVEIIEDTLAIKLKLLVLKTNNQYKILNRV